MKPISYLMPAIAAALLGGCTSSMDSGGSTTKPPSQLNFLQFAATAPTLCSNSVTFDATKGVDVEAALEFPEPGEPADCSGGTEDFVRLRIDKESLLELPNGTPLNDGDVVSITMTWVGGDSIMVQLEPTGLKFNPAKPAELKIEYGEASDDLDHNGTVDSEDDEIEQELGLWRQAVLGDDFVLIGSVKLEDENEFEAELNGFSRYAIAY
ncbi:MAG TPA: hypothetical protein VH438_09245 [Gemmatimonadales bacterium]|jgi:hypothetical protein